ncbi:hypothetical protein U0070_010317 [Myodes glareolus]|uniref:Calcium-responsive transcription factor n=1 Tax=Myodes glareolus TaxID=447135 RepID=A0AAW0HY25_MYOGA
MEQRCLLGASCSDGEESERGAQESEITCMDSGDPSFGQNEPPTILPVTAETDDPLTSQDLPETLTDTQALYAEQFHLLDPNGQPLQYDLHSLGDSNAQMTITTSPSENGQVLHVIPPTQTGMAQVIIPREPLVDATRPQDASEEKPTDRSLPTVRADTLEASAKNWRLLPGYCVSETELESILTFHKQQTQSVWGTRQSPRSAKPAMRLMWKSQYVPYDGIPFVNAGFTLKRYRSSLNIECLQTPRLTGRSSEWSKRNLHHAEEEPVVARKIQELVSQGVGQVYAVRKQLRKFVERELFKPDEVPERHNLSFFPTVNDIKNHIHEVQKSLRTGDVVYNPEIIPATEFTGRTSYQQRFEVTAKTLLSDGSQALVSGNGHLLWSFRTSGYRGNAVVNNHSLLLGQSQNLGTDTCLTQNSSTASTVGNLPESVQNLVMDQLVKLTTLGYRELEGCE